MLSDLAAVYMLGEDVCGVLLTKHFAYSHSLLFYSILDPELSYFHVSDSA